MARLPDPARVAALEAGARHYHGKPCPNGHTLRHTINRACVTCQADAQRARRARSTIHDDILG